MPLTYKDQRVRDLAWSIASPALLQPVDNHTDWKTSAWFTEIYESYTPCLRQLDEQPDELHRWLIDCNTRRLGSYFEKLWGFWLTTNGRYRLLIANLPVRNTIKTIGEFDLLVEDTQTGEHQHWELALKFYLGAGDLKQTCNWWGPMKRDRLDLKLAHMQTHQCRLSQHPDGRRVLQAAGINIHSCCAIVKGRLFYPEHFTAGSASTLFSSDHLYGWWAPFKMFKTEIHSANFYKLLPKDSWLSEVNTDCDLLTSTDLHDYLETTNLTRPQAIAILQDDQEISRGFITPDSWYDSIS